MIKLNFRFLLTTVSKLGNKFPNLNLWTLLFKNQDQNLLPVNAQELFFYLVLKVHAILARFNIKSTAI